MRGAVRLKRTETRRKKTVLLNSRPEQAARKGQHAPHRPAAALHNGGTPHDRSRSRSHAHAAHARARARAPLRAARAIGHASKTI
jgi:hypothetical protein